MGMAELVTQLIGRLKQSVPFVELRTAPASDSYLEAVLLRAHLEGCCRVLREALGPPVKDFGQAATFDAATQQAVDQVGGIRVEQCLFFATGERQQAGFAALWPWESDATRVTLKTGLVILR